MNTGHGESNDDGTANEADDILGGGGIDVAGASHLPVGFGDMPTCPALVIVTPGGGVEEQIGATRRIRGKRRRAARSERSGDAG